MKQSLLFAFLLASTLVFAQVPQGISYQAIAFDTNGNPVTNSTIGIKISILDNAVDGEVSYEETHSKTTNTQGLFNLNIGQGTPQTGTFSGINWGGALKFLKVEVDPAGGTNYEVTGTTQLMSVPYALYAEGVNVASLPQSITAKSNTSEVIVVYTSTTAYGFYQNGGSGGNWAIRSLSGTPLGAIATDDSIVVYTSTTAYGFYQNSGSGGNWSIRSLSGTPIGAVATNDTAVVYTTTTAYGFYQNSGSGGNWAIRSLSGTPLGAVASKNTIVVFTDVSAYGFYQNSGSGGNWSIRSLSGDPIDAISK